MFVLMFVLPSVASRVPTSSSTIMARSSWVGGSLHHLLCIVSVWLTWDSLQEWWSNYHVCCFVCIIFTNWMCLCGASHQNLFCDGLNPTLCPFHFDMIFSWMHILIQKGRILQNIEGCIWIILYALKTQPLKIYK